MNPQEKRKALIDLATGRKTIAEVVPLKAVLIETVKIEDRPGFIYKLTGKPISQEEIDVMTASAKKRGAVVLNEVSTYLTWQDFVKGREYFNGDDPTSEQAAQTNHAA